MLFQKTLLTKSILQVFNNNNNNNKFNNTNNLENILDQ